MYAFYNTTTSPWIRRDAKARFVGKIFGGLYDDYCKRNNSKSGAWDFTAVEHISKQFQLLKLDDNPNDYSLVILNRLSSSTDFAQIFQLIDGKVFTHLEDKSVDNWSVVKLRLRQLYPRNTNVIDETDRLVKNNQTREVVVLPSALPAPQNTIDLVEFFYLRNNWCPSGPMAPALLFEDSQRHFGITPTEVSP